MEGESLDDERVTEAVSRSLAHLQKRDRTRKQVEQHLAAAGTEPEVVASAVEELERLGYVDDERFARNYAEDRRSLDGWGSERIAARLVEAGIDPGLVEAVAGSRDRAEELADAVGLLARRLPGAPGDDRERERALGLLVRRGYEKELAYDAVRAFEREAA